MAFSLQRKMYSYKESAGLSLQDPNLGTSKASSLEASQILNFSWLGIIRVLILVMSVSWSLCNSVIWCLLSLTPTMNRRVLTSVFLLRVPRLGVHRCFKQSLTEHPNEDMGLSPELKSPGSLEDGDMWLFWEGVAVDSCSNTFWAFNSVLWFDLGGKA